MGRQPPGHIYLDVLKTLFISLCSTVPHYFCLYISMFFFRYRYQFSSLSGVSILGRAIVAIAGSGLILIRTTVVYCILFAPPFSLVCREANKASVLSSHPSLLVVAYFICAGYTRSSSGKSQGEHSCMPHDHIWNGQNTVHPPTGLS